MPNGSAVVDRPEPGRGPELDRFFDTTSDPPPTRPTHVRRPGLDALRRRDADRKVVLISAAAGYGKSTALADWCADDARPTIWSPLNDSDNSARALLTRLMSGLHRLQPLDEDSLAIVRRRSPGVDASMLQVMSRCMAERSPFVLALDDLHAVTSADSTSVVRHLIDTLPAGSQVAIATRVDPDIRLARLRAAGELTEIRADLLAMTVDSTAEYLTRAGVAAAADDVARLHGATEGWPAGIALACLAAPAAPADGRRDIPAHLDGQRHQIADYFIEEVLSALDEQTRSFLLRTSVVRRFSAELANAMLERPDSDEMIRRLAASNVFVIALDDEHRWFRYHHLFQDLLVDRLDRADEHARTVLLGRAARWHADHGTVDEAFDYAQRSGDVRTAGHLMLGSWGQLATRGQLHTLIRWIGRSSDAEISTDPAFSIISGWICALTGDVRRAEFFVKAAARHPLDAASPDGAASLASALANLRSALGNGGVAQMLVDGQFVYDAERATQSRWLLGGCRALGSAHLTLGNLDEATAVLQEGVRAAGGSDHTAFAEAHCHGLLAFAHLDRRELDDAERCVRAARRLTDRNGLGSTLEVLAPAVAEAIVAFRRGDPERARALSAPVIERLSIADAMPWYKASLSIRLGELAADLDDRHTAHQLVTEARRMLAVIPDAGSLPSRLDQLAERLRAPAGGYATLTPAERRVLVQLATHKTLAEIGKTLYVSRTTIKSHVASIYSKLGVTTRNEAVAYLPSDPGAHPILPSS